MSAAAGLLCYLSAGLPCLRVIWGLAKFSAVSRATLRVISCAGIWLHERSSWIALLSFSRATLWVIWGLATGYPPGMQLDCFVIFQPGYPPGYLGPDPHPSTLRVIFWGLATYERGSWIALDRSIFLIPIPAPSGLFGA